MSQRFVAAAFLALAVLCFFGAADAKDKAVKADPAQGQAAEQPADQNSLPRGFNEQYVWDKVDPELQQAYKDALAAGDPLRRFDCYVRDQNVIDDGDRSFLISKGFNVRTVGGNVASGYMKAQDLPLVANLPFVSKIRLSKQPGS